MYSANEIAEAGGGRHLAFWSQPYRGRAYQECIADEQKGDSRWRGKWKMYSNSQRPELFFRTCFRPLAKIAALGGGKRYLEKTPFVPKHPMALP